MVLIKALNNNTALVKENSKEYIVMGKGIAFNRKPNDEIPPSKVEKKYVLQNKSFDKLMEHLSVEDLELANQIIKQAEATGARAHRGADADEAEHTAR